MTTTQTDRRRATCYGASMGRFNCQSCGACCCNTERNRYAGNREYVEVTRTEPLYRTQRDLLKTLGFRKVEIFGGTVGKFSRRAKPSPREFELLVVAEK